PEVSRAKPRLRMVTLGGSSTYCTLVSDDETWPHYLGKHRSCEVINLGLPGYTSLENLIQANLWFSELKPDIAVLYGGWNDLRNAHVLGLKPDYSDFHGPSQKYTQRVYPGPV